MSISVKLSIIAILLGVVGLIGAWSDPGGFLLGKRAHWVTISFASLAIGLAGFNIVAHL